MDISYREIKPSPALQPYVDCFWFHTFEGAGTEISPVQRCLPFGVAELIIHLDDRCEVLYEDQWKPLPQIFIAGMYCDPVMWRSMGPSRNFGIMLKPESFHLLFGMPAASVTNDYQKLDNFIGGEAELLAECIQEAESFEEMIKIAETFLLTQLMSTRIEQNYLTEATRLIRSAGGHVRLDEVSQSLNVSARHLQRCFNSAFGFSPKTYMRIIRFRNAYYSLQNLDKIGGYAGLSYLMGYADQAHFIREFKEFSGMIPNMMLNSDGHIFGSENALSV